MIRKLVQGLAAGRTVLYQRHPYRSRPSKRRLTASLVLVGVGSYLGWKHLHLPEDYTAYSTPARQVLLTSCDLEGVITDCKDVVLKKKDQVGAPGLAIAVSVNGQVLWSEGFGYSDVENQVACKPETVMRIASISKPLTAMALARLIENDQIDIDKPIRHYLPELTDKDFGGKEVKITARQLASHLGGIRSYEKDPEKVMKIPVSLQGDGTSIVNKTASDSLMKEFYIGKHYPSVAEALSLFKDDSLISEPGEAYVYSTHGYTLLSAVIEKAAQKPFKEVMRNVFNDIGMENTGLDLNRPLIYNRSRYYQKDKSGHLVNSPYVDTSCKWAGGGFVSTVGDLLKFGNAMLYGYQHQRYTSSQPTNEANNNISVDPPYLKTETVEMLWKPVCRSSVKDVEYYSLGWFVVPPNTSYGGCDARPFYVNHTGGAVGASSVLLVLPRNKDMSANYIPPQGVVVAIVTNMQAVGLEQVAFKIARRFDDLVASVSQ